MTDDFEYMNNFKLPENWETMTPEQKKIQIDIFKDVITLYKLKINDDKKVYKIKSK